MEVLPQIILNAVITGATYSLIALGFNLMYGATKFINMAYGSLAAVGGYVAFLFLKLIDIPLAFAVLGGVLIPGLLGLGMAELIFKPLRRRKASSPVLFIASLGIFTAFGAFLAILFGSQFQLLAAGAAKTYHVVGGIITLPQVFIAIAAVVVGVFLFVLLRYTAFGKAIRAVSDDEEVAKIIGINTDRVVSMVFFISSAIAGLAGVLIGFDVGIQPTLGFYVILQGAIASIVGGIGNLYGGIAGSFLLGFAENFGIWKVGTEWRPVVASVILIIFLTVRPQGIFKR